MELSSGSPHVENKTHLEAKCNGLGRELFVEASEKYEVTMPSSNGVGRIVREEWRKALSGTRVLPELFEHCDVEMREVMLDASGEA